MTYPKRPPRSQLALSAQRNADVVSGGNRDGSEFLILKGFENSGCGLGNVALDSLGGVFWVWSLNHSAESAIVVGSPCPKLLKRN